MFTTNF